MKKKLLTACFVGLSICRLFAEDDDLLTGLDAYSRSDWNTATQSFEQTLITVPSDRIEALYWLVMSETSAQNYQRALSYADAFLASAPKDERAAEVRYQKGRLLHISGDYDMSSKILYRFIEDYPNHPKVPSAYYWIGENLYAVGNYAEARTRFNEVVINYPQSGKVSDARYKILLIDQQAVRDELLRMAGEVNTAESSAKESDNPKTEGDADKGTVVTTVGNDKEITERLAGLEKKLDELSAALARIVEEQEYQREQAEIREREAARQELEKRRQELAALKQRTRTLEKLYEQRTKGVK